MATTEDKVLQAYAEGIENPKPQTHDIFIANFPTELIGKEVVVMIKGVITAEDRLTYKDGDVEIVKVGSLSDLIVKNFNGIE